jgi:hypothetical protein
MTLTLYRVHCVIVSQYGRRDTDYFCMASSPWDARQQAEDEESPDDGLPFYGTANYAEPCSFPAMIKAIEASPWFPGGNVAATEEALDAMREWKAQRAVCTETGSLFAEAVG